MGETFTPMTSAGQITPAALSVLDDTTISAMRTTLAAASSTTATQSIYVDKAATGSGTGVNWTNAFTTIQAAIDSLPAVIHHAVTIYVRKGATPYRETVTVQRVISAGSITIRGEYYWNAQAASNSTANKLVKNESDDFTNVAVGDYVALLQYSGTYEASAPSGVYYGTVTNVDNKASGYVTISMDSSVTPTTGWKYIICKTEISGSDDGSTPTRDYCIVVNSNTTINGFAVTLPNSIAINCISGFSSTTMIVNCGAKSGFLGSTRGVAATINSWVQYGNSSGTGLNFTFSTGTIYALHMGFVHRSNPSAILQVASDGNARFTYCIIRTLSGSTSGAGIISQNNSMTYFGYSSIYGAGSGDKLGTGLTAQYGGLLTGSITPDSTTVTTAKTPANWAATTDGSYIA